MEWASKWSSAKRRRRTAAFRILLLVLIIWFCYDTAIHRSQARGAANAVNAPFGSKSTTDSSLASDDSSSLQKIPRHKSDDRQFQAALHPSPDAEPTGVAAVDPARRINLRDALHRILTLLPDELHVRDLLRPISGTGEERLREMGLRTRSFKVLFEAWEDLHTFPGSDAMYVRDDMITYIRNHPELASSLQTDMPQLIRSYETYRTVITRLSMLLFPWTAPYFSDHTLLHSQLYSGGRGLVFSAGDAQAPFLLTSIPSIRRLGCDLPIEVLYLGDGDLSEDFRSDLESLPGVITRDLSQMVNDSGWTLAGWAGKPFAILLSSFREAIFIDADSLFFQNPELLFEDPAYVKTGALFFKDRLMMPEAKKRWLQRIIPKPISKNVVQSRLWTGESGHMQESGVVVVDKWKHFVALLLVTRMNGPDRDGDSSVGKVGVYDMVYGDKETFWLGWELAGDTGYAFHDGDAGIMGVLEPSTSPGNTVNDTSSNQPDEVSGQSQAEPANYTICGPQLLHLDHDGKPLWFNGWLLPNKFAEHKHQKPAKFEAYLREPREIRDPGAWQLHENNICCLTSTAMAEFSDVEQGTLSMILEYGRHSGALKAGRN
ncbi:mannosyltransferase putative-domain-containing protein [Aspergillus floccosus]